MLLSGFGKSRISLTRLNQHKHKHLLRSFWGMMDQKSKNPRVAVIGLGLTGVSSVKNLLEVGFNVVGFERNQYIGGLWQWNDDPSQTTVLRSTKANISKQSSCYTDFPFPEDVPNYPPGEDIAKYIRDYADHFQLDSHFKLGCAVKRILPSDDGSGWLLEVEDDARETQIEKFDKVLVTTGPYHTPFSPNMPGEEHFKGKMMHAQAFKSPDPFANKRVVVVGLSNTGGDVAVDLSSVAEKVYLSHRSGARLFSRAKSGDKPADHRISRRISGFGKSLSTRLPKVSASMSAFLAEQNMLRTNKIDPEWKLLPAPPIGNSAPVMNDHLISKFADGSVTSVTGIKGFLPCEDDAASSSSIELTDGTVLHDIDVVIHCTGYYADFSICSPEADPSALPTPEWDSSPNANGLVYPRLYQGMFSTKHPHTLAFIGPFRGHSFAAFSNSDLSSQAIAQVWAGNYELPPKSEIEAWCDENYQYSLKQIASWRIAKIGSNPMELERWLNDVAGNGVNENLGWSWKAWQFWWSDRKLYRLAMDGIDSPFVYRLFEGRPGGRKRWDGAREAIIRVNGSK